MVGLCASAHRQRQRQRQTLLLNPVGGRRRDVNRADETLLTFSVIGTKMRRIV